VWNIEAVGDFGIGLFVYVSENDDFAVVVTDSVECVCDGPFEFTEDSFMVWTLSW
jgi:hypothetical protein